jgi:hypothetical protein
MRVLLALPVPLAPLALPGLKASQENLLLSLGSLSKLILTNRDVVEYVTTN